MIASALVISVTNLPAAIIVALGVLGALDVRRRHSVARSARAGIPMPDALPGRVYKRISFLADADMTDDATYDANGVGDLDAKDAALQLLDAWSACPRSIWRALGVRCLLMTGSEAGANAASEAILEGVVAHHVDSVEAWVVRDAVDTAWSLAPKDAPALPPSIESAARRTLTNATLAVLTRAWLPAQDYERLLARVAH